MAKHLICGVFQGSSKKWDKKKLCFETDKGYTCSDIITQLGIIISDIKTDADTYYCTPNKQYETFIKNVG